MTQDYNFNIFGFPGALTIPEKPDELITNTMFIPLARSMGQAGILANSIEFGAFRVAWDVGIILCYILRTFINFYVLCRNTSSLYTPSRFASPFY